MVSIPASVGFGRSLRSAARQSEICFFSKNGWHTFISAWCNTRWAKGAAHICRFIRFGLGDEIFGKALHFFLANALDSQHGFFRDLVQLGQLRQFLVREDDKGGDALFGSYLFSGFPQFGKFLKYRFLSLVASKNEQSAHPSPPSHFFQQLALAHK